MTGLLLWKEHLKEFYQKYNQLLHPLIRFLFTLCTVLSINSAVGYMAKLKNPLVVFMVCLVGTLLPNCMLVFLIGGFLAVHLYAVSVEMALIAVLVMMIIGILYYGFKPGDSWLMVLTPLAFLFKIRDPCGLRHLFLLPYHVCKAECRRSHRRSRRGHGTALQTDCAVRIFKSDHDGDDRYLCGRYSCGIPDPPPFH